MAGTWRCADPDCDHAAGGWAEPGDGSGYAAAKAHGKDTGHDIAGYFDDAGELRHGFDQTVMAWASRKGIIRKGGATLADDASNDDELPGNDGVDDDEIDDGDLGGDEGLLDDGPGGPAYDDGRPTARPRHARGYAYGYGVAVQFSLPSETLLAIESHMSEFADEYRDPESGAELEKGQRFAMFFAGLVARDMVDHAERYPIGRFVTKPAMDYLHGAYQAVDAHHKQLDEYRNQLDQRWRDIVAREAAIAAIAQGGAPVA